MAWTCITPSRLSSLIGQQASPGWMHQPNRSATSSPPLEGSNLDDEHDPEGATIAFEREQLTALRRQACDRIVEIDEALQRLAAGTYGMCEQCGAVIPDERLAIRPAARTCVRCAGRSR